jgi:hypothetical protein
VLGPRSWLRRLRVRSPGFVRRLHSYYSRVRLLPSVHHWRAAFAFPMRPMLLRAWAERRPPGFRAKSVIACLGSLTTPSRATGSPSRPPPVLPSRFTHPVGARKSAFAAQYPAHDSPHQRFTADLTISGAWSGAGAAGYAFTVWNLHPLLLADLSGARGIGGTARYPRARRQSKQGSTRRSRRTTECHRDHCALRAERHFPSRWLSVALNLGDLRVEPCVAARAPLPGAFTRSP